VLDTNSLGKSLRLNLILDMGFCATVASCQVRTDLSRSVYKMTCVNVVWVDHETENEIPDSDD